jgi:hypothetical protein
MKKAFMAFALCLVSAFCFAQVSIQKEEPKYEFPIKSYTSFTHCLQDDTFCLVVRSDNEYESKGAVIELGNKSQSIESINAMLTMMKDEGEYKIGKYKCHAYAKYIYLYQLGDLEYTAGSYTITEANLKKCKKWLENN